ncbi:MAG: hypothetical protein QM765_28685 [Myxococcales bacterium]
MSGVQGGFFAGFKSGRVVLGLGIDLARYSLQFDGSSTSATTRLTFTPTLQVATLRSRDLRVELYLEAGLGLGHLFTDGRPDYGNVEIGYRVGPGLRYWIHPQLAISSLVALTGDFTLISGLAAPYGYGGYTIGQTSILAGLQFLGVF